MADWGENKNKGIIINSLSNACEPITIQDGFLTNSADAYQQLFWDTISGQTICDLPPVDFESNTLLGLMASGQCEVKYIREVEEMKGEKRYHYRVTIKSCGLCKMEVYSYNWVVVPKLPDGWTVSFKTIEK